MAHIPGSPGSHPGFYHHEDPVGEHPADHPSVLAVVRHRLFDGEVLDGVYRGQAPGVHLLGMTNRRLMLLEETTEPGRLALTSVPLTRVTSVGIIPDEDGDVEAAHSLAIRVLPMIYDLRLRSSAEALEVHDLLVWRIAEV